MNVTTLATNAASLVIVGSLAYRQLQARKIEAGSLWIRPALFLGLSLALAAASMRIAPSRTAILEMAVPAGIVVGLLAGFLVARATIPTGRIRFGVLTIEGSRNAALIWITLFLVGLLARTALQSAQPILYLDLNVASITALAVASTVIAAVYYRLIRARTGASLSEGIIL